MNGAFELKYHKGDGKMRNALITLLVAVAALAGPMDIFVDCEGGNRVDLVFVIDTSGSMCSTISAIRSFTGVLDSILSECDVRWGIVAFVDSVMGSHDFDTTTPGIDLTDDYYSFRDDLPWGTTGGSDTPDEDLDALWVAAHCINWRPDALHITFLFTDAVFCEISDHCFNCHSNLTKEECLDTLMNHDIILYPIVRDPLYYSGCVPAPPYHIDFWRLAADTTGGAFWNLLDDWQDSLRMLASSINSGSMSEIAVRNNLASPVDAVLKLESIGGVEFHDSLFDLGTIAAGGLDTAWFHLTIDDTATMSAFHVIGDFDDGAYVETLLVTLDSSGCHEAVIELVPGWNLVSLPSGIPSVPVSYFETAIGDAYLYVTLLADYESSDILAPALGYWILSLDSARVMFGGVPIDGYFMPTFRGWNLLGGGSVPFSPSEGLTGGAPIWPMFEYRGAYYPAAEIEVGAGYWLLDNSTGRWEAP